MTTVEQVSPVRTLVGSRWARRIALLGACGMAAAALAQPALARPTVATGTTEPTMTLELGADPITASFPMIVGDDANDTADINNPVTPTHEDPKGCLADVGCALVPIKLDIPAAKFAGNGFLVSITLKWDTQVSQTGVPAVGNVYGDQLEGIVYDTPPVMDANGDPTYTSYQFYEPATLTDNAPPSADISLVVVNSQGVNTGGFTVTAGVIDNTPLSTYYPPGVTSYSTYGKGTNTTAVAVPKKGNTPAQSTGTKPTTTTKTKTTKITEPLPVGVTTVPVTAVTTTGTVTTIVPPVTGVVAPPAAVPVAAPAPQIAADATRVAVGGQPAGALDPALVSLASDTSGVSKLGLKDENIVGNKVASTVATGTAKHSWLVVLSLLIPALAVMGWMFFLARKRRAQVDTRSLGTARTA